MILYTPYQVDQVLYDPSASRTLREFTLAHGITLLVEPVESGYRIERVISGNCNVYLLEDYQPGKVVKLT